MIINPFDGGILRADNQPPATLAQQLNTTGLAQWLIDNGVVPLLILIALASFVAAMKGNISKIATIAGCLIPCLILLGFAVVPNAPAETGRFLAGLVGVGG